MLRKYVIFILFFDLYLTQNNINKKKTVAGNIFELNFLNFFVSYNRGLLTIIFLKIKNKKGFKRRIAIEGGHALF